MVHKVLGYVDEVSIHSAVQNFRTDFFLNRRQMRKTHTFSLLKISSIGIYTVTLRCVIPVVCVTNEREESVVNQHN